MFGNETMLVTHFMPRNRMKGFHNWVVAGNTGRSSLCIAGVMLKCDDIPQPGVPHDPADFKRCYDLFKAMPQWRERIQEVADRFPHWSPFVNRWDEMERMYETAVANDADRCPKLYDLLQAMDEDSRLIFSIQQRDEKLKAAATGGEG